MGSFAVEWDDFSGGLFVARPTTSQQENQWRGMDLILNRVSGALTPVKAIPQFVGSLSSAESWLEATQPIVATNGNIVWVERISSPSGAIHFYRITDPFGTPTQTSVAFPGASNPRDGCRPVATNEAGTHYVYVPSESTYIARYNVAANTVSTITTPVAFTSIVKWGDFMLGTDSAGTGLIYFSAARNFTSWTAGDNFPVAQDGQPVTNLVPFPLELYIGKSTGWWVVQGVLGVNSTLRQVATTGGTTAVDTALGTPIGVMYVPTAGSVLAAVQGINTRPMHFAGDSVAGPLQYLGPTGEVGVSSTGTIPVYHPMRYWSEFNRPSDANTAALRMIDATIDEVPGPAGFGPVASALYKVAGLGTKVVGWPLWEADVDEAASSTVELREFRSKGGKKFTVREMLVEVLVDRQAADRGIVGVDASVRMSGRTDLPPDIATQASMARPASIHTDQISSDRTALMYRFGCSDGGVGRGFTPILTLRGCALRRVIAECEDAK